MPQYLLNTTQKRQVIDQTLHYIQLANNQLDLSMPDIDIVFDLKGRASGMFTVRSGQLRIRYNPIIFSKFFEDTLLNTVAHEVAHYVVYHLYGSRVKPHGDEWKRVMNLFEVVPEVTSRYDVSDLPLHRQARHDYRCACMRHQLSTTRHNKVQNRKAVYKCRKCFEPLEYDVK